MKHQRHFESATASREALQVGELIADLDCILQILNSDIVAEEERAQVFKRSQPEYPMLARTLAARRDNLTDTIAALERRLAAIHCAQLNEASA
jgi:septation ring formation regulator EzrA